MGRPPGDASAAAGVEVAPRSAGRRSPRFARLYWDADGMPHSADFRDRYFSRAGALEESAHVFLDGNRLARRWQAQNAAGAQQEFTIAELGFGSGLNFLNAWHLQLQSAPALRLHYIGLEYWPLHEEQMRRILDAHPALAPLARCLLRAWCCPTPGWHCMELAPPAGQDGTAPRLSLLIDEAARGLQALRAAVPAPRVNAWFLDGFAPARNRAMWTPSLFRSMHQLSTADCTFASYTAASRVRLELEQSGFRVRKAPGHGDKKHILCGALATPPAAPVAAPVFGHRRPGSALVIGGGLAGCATAAALARRGLDVTLLEKNAAIAQEASAQPCSILYPGLSPAGTPAARFSLAAYHCAVRSYRALFDRGLLSTGEDGAFCGMLQLGCNERLRRRQHKLAEIYAACPELLRLVDADEAGALSGIPQRHGGLFHPAAGWLCASALCTALVTDARVELGLGQWVQRLAPEGADGGHRRPGWVARDARGAVLARADVAVVAAGHAAHALLPQYDPGLQAVRGQSTAVPATEQSRCLRVVLCHQGYISPALGAAGDQCHVLGATHEPPLPQAGPRTDSDLRNLRTLARHVPALFAQTPAAAECRGTVGVRCTRVGRAPLAGEVPGVPGLYLNLAHGGRGLCLVPLCAEIIAAAAGAEMPPVEAELLAYAAPPAAAI